MRQRLLQKQRKSEILKQAEKLFHEFGIGKTEMEDIRKVCGISRGGLYHHFANKTAILDAIVATEAAALTGQLEATDDGPIEFLLETASHQLGSDAGIIAALKDAEERQTYLASLDRAFSQQLIPVLSARLQNSLLPNTDPTHIAELFLTVNALINRRVILREWTDKQAAAFAATALCSLKPFWKDATQLKSIIMRFEEKAESE